jgi:hypothetical protein
VGGSYAVVNKSSPTSRKNRTTERSDLEADRRFALLVALLTPEDARRGEDDGLERSMASDPPAPDESAGEWPARDDGKDERLRLRGRNLIFLLFIGGALPAILFIVAASFIKL